MDRLKRAVLGLSAAVAFGCAHPETSASAPEAPAEAAPEAASDEPATTLHVTSAPIDALRSPYFSALELTFENPSNKWHEVRRVSISSERQMLGPTLESLVGARLRAWQLAARDAHHTKDGPPHVALEKLAADEASGEAGAATPAAPPEHLLAGAFMIAPGLSTRKWVVLFSPAKDALLGQDLMLAYELEDGKVERVLVQYPKPADEH